MQKDAHKLGITKPEWIGVCGEERVRDAIKKNFPSPGYHLLNNITLPLTYGGTTQVDHILICPKGVFVIETKNMAGVVFGVPSRNIWKQVVRDKLFEFKNPLHQNYQHQQTVIDVLDFIPSNAVISTVVFSGSATFGWGMPENVFTPAGLSKFITNDNNIRLSPTLIQRCIGKIELARYELTLETDIEHVDFIQRKHGYIDYDKY